MLSNIVFIIIKYLLKRKYPQRQRHSNMLLPNFEYESLFARETIDTDKMLRKRFY